MVLLLYYSNFPAGCVLSESTCTIKAFSIYAHYIVMSRIRVSIPRSDSPFLSLSFSSMSVNLTSMRFLALIGFLLMGQSTTLLGLSSFVPLLSGVRLGTQNEGRAALEVEGPETKSKRMGSRDHLKEEPSLF